MKPIPIDETVQYQLRKTNAPENQFSGVGVGQEVVGPAYWLEGPILIVEREQERLTGHEPRYLRTSPIVAMKKLHKGVWELTTVNGSTYRLSKLSIPTAKYAIP